MDFLQIVQREDSFQGWLCILSQSAVGQHFQEWTGEGQVHETTVLEYLEIIILFL